MPKTNEKAKNLRKCIKSPKMPKITKMTKNHRSAKNTKSHRKFQKSPKMPCLFKYLHGSHGLSAWRARRTKSRSPKGLQLEMGARRASRLLVLLYFWYFYVQKSGNVEQQDGVQTEDLSLVTLLRNKLVCFTHTTHALHITSRYIALK